MFSGLYYVQLGDAADRIVAGATLKAFNYQRLTAPTGRLYTDRYADYARR